MTETPVALIVFLALGAVAVVLALLLVRARQELSRAQLQTEATGTELERASRVASDLGARLKAVEAELRHLVHARIPELAASLTHPNVPVPGPLGTATLSPDLDRSLDSVLSQVKSEVTKERTRVDAAAQAAMRGATTTVQALLYQMQTLLQRMQEKYEDPLVAEDLLAADFLNEQALRRIQSTAVVCGAWPGLTRENSHIADVVVGASSRLSGYERIQATNLMRDPVGVIARAVEPVAVTLTELMANALHYSHPELPVVVTLQQGNTGVSVIIDDAGVGMTSEEFTRAKRLMSGEEDILLTELGDPPRNGFAAVGRLVRQYGFSAHAEASPYGGVRAVVHIPGDPLLTLLDEEEHPISAMAPTAPYSTPVLPGRPATGDHPPTSPASRSGGTSPPPGPADPAELPRRRRRSRAQTQQETQTPRETESAGAEGGSAAFGAASSAPASASGSGVPGGEGGAAVRGLRGARPSPEPEARSSADPEVREGRLSGSGRASAPAPTPEESAALWAAFQEGTASGRAAVESDSPAARPRSSGSTAETGGTRTGSTSPEPDFPDRTGTARSEGGPNAPEGNASEGAPEPPEKTAAPGGTGAPPGETTASGEAGAASGESGAGSERSGTASEISGAGSETSESGSARETAGAGDTGDGDPGPGASEGSPPE